MKTAIFGTLFMASFAMAETHYVQAFDTSFQPDVIHVAPGDTVIWEYVSGYPHTVTSGNSDPCPTGTPDGLFDGELNGSGDTFQWDVPADAPSEVPYFCQPHCSMGMTGWIYVDQPRLSIGLVDIAMCDFSYSEGDGEGRIEIGSDGENSSFGWGVEAEEMDIDVVVISNGNVFIHDASAGTTEPCCSDCTYTLIAGQKYMFHGFAPDDIGGGFEFVMEWPEEGDEGGMNMGLVGANANVNSSTGDGDDVSFRASGNGEVVLTLSADKEGMEVQMVVIANVTSTTLDLPDSGEEGNVEIPVGKTHTIELNGGGAGNGAGMGMLIMQMGDGDGDGGGDYCPGDANQDGIVDVDDILMVISSFGNTCP